MALKFADALKVQQSVIAMPGEYVYGPPGKRRARTYSQAIAMATRGIEAGAVIPPNKPTPNGPDISQRQKPDWRGHYLGADGLAKNLYVRRNLKNAQQLYDWAQAAGIPNLVPPEEMHCTQVYSRKPVDLDVRQDTIVAKRYIAPLGDKGAVVLHFDCQEMQARHREALAAGASHDFPRFLSHVTLSYDAGGIDVTQIKAPDFPLEFGPEVHEPINDDWAEDKGLRAENRDFATRIARS